MNLEGRVFGLPVWAALLALGAAGVGAYFLFFRGGGAAGAPPTPVFGGTGTNPADYSASIGILENQELQNLQTNQMVSTQVGNLANASAGYYTQLEGDTLTRFNDLSGQVLANPGSTLNTISGQHAA